MATNATVPNKIGLYPDQLSSLLSLARVLPARKYLVILALLHYLQGDSLKSTATRDQIEEFTGLKKRTIYTYIQEFDRLGLIKQWRGTFDLKQKFYRVNLPVREEVFDFYGKTDETVPYRQDTGKPDLPNPSNSPIQVGLSAAPDGDAVPVPDAAETVSAREEGMTEMTTENHVAPAEIATEPALDPRIAQVIDLKATDTNGVIVKFLKGLGLLRINNFGAVRIDREGLLSYLLERNANSLEGFSRLVNEFKSSPQFDLPPDEDLQIDLHNDFFDYPYGAQWFWQECRTKDANGFQLREGGFGSNVLTFMERYGLKRLDDIVRQVAAMDEALRPSPSVSSTSSLG